MIPLPTVGPLELAVIVGVGVLLTFGVGLVVRIKRAWRRRRSKKERS